MPLSGGTHLDQVLLTYLEQIGGYGTDKRKFTDTCKYVCTGRQRLYRNTFAFLWAYKKLFCH